MYLVQTIKPAAANEQEANETGPCKSTFMYGLTSLTPIAELHRYQAEVALNLEWACMYVCMYVVYAQAYVHITHIWIATDPEPGKTN